MSLEACLSKCSIAKFWSDLLDHGKGEPLGWKQLLSVTAANSIAVLFCFRDSAKGCPECGKNFTDLSSPLSDTSALKGIVTKADKEGSTQTQEMEHAKAQV